MGVLEATVNCGFVLITAKWYKKYEHSTRVGIWAASNGFSTMVGGVVAYGCSRGSQEAGLTFHGWRILALVTGGITILFAVCMYFFMAESPIRAHFFSEEDKMLAVERLRENHQGVGSHQFKWYQFREAFVDIRVSYPDNCGSTFSNSICRPGYTSCSSYLPRFRAAGQRCFRHF